MPAPPLTADAVLATLRVDVLVGPCSARQRYISVLMSLTSPISPG